MGNQNSDFELPGPRPPLPTAALALRLEERTRRLRAQALRQARMRARRRRSALFGLLLLVTALVLGFTLTSPAGPGGGPVGQSGAAERTGRAARPVISPLSALVARAKGSLPSLPFPSKGEGAVAIAGSGVVAASGHQEPVPIASLTKIMTAYLVLAAHPLRGDEQGPVLQLTAADHAAWSYDSSHNLSNVELVKGESLSERQLLEALLLPSADNVADLLARWVAGSETAFVTLMNSTAARLGMTGTHYADDSGVDPHSVSTAADQALLASLAMQNPVFASIVRLPDAPFPVAGHIWSANPAIGVDGIVGVKSGFTQAAGGCLVTAAWRRDGGRPVLVVEAVTGQPYGLWQAAEEDEGLLGAATAHLQLLSPFGRTVRLAEMTVPWTGRRVGLVLPASLRLGGWGGLAYSGRIVPGALDRSQLRHGVAAGSTVATLVLSSQFGPALALPLAVARAVPAPPAGTFSLSRPLTIRLAG